MCAEPHENKCISYLQPAQSLSSLTCTVIITLHLVSLLLLSPFVLYTAAGVVLLKPQSDQKPPLLKTLRSLPISLRIKSILQGPMLSGFNNSLTFFVTPSLLLFPDSWPLPGPEQSWVLLYLVPQNLYNLLPDCVLESVQLSPHFSDSWPL